MKWSLGLFVKNEMIVYLNNLIHKHFLAIVFALFIGAIMVGPQLLFIYSSGSDYRGIYMANTDAEYHYMARMQEAVDNGGLGNPFIYENKTGVPSTIYTISETILAWPAKIFNFSIPNLNLFYKFLLPVIIGLLIYSFVFRLIDSRMWSVAAMFAVLFGSTLLSFPDIIHFLHWDQVYGSFAIYSRPINPEVSSIIFFVYLHLLLSALNKKTWAIFTFLGVILGLSFYIYFYSYTFFLALNAVLLIMNLISKKYDIVLKIAGATSLGIGIGLWSIMNTIAIYTHPNYKFMAELIDVASTHHPIFSVFGLLTLVVLILFSWHNREKNNLLFLWSLLITSFIVINQQVITGILLQEGHYHWYFNVPIFIFVFIFVLYYLVNNKPRWSFGLAVTICIISTASTFQIQSSSYHMNFSEATNNQRYGMVISWLNENTSKESVVFADNYLSQLIPAYTGANVVWEDHAAFYLVSPERRLFNPTTLLAKQDFKKALSEYRVDYFIWDIKKEPEWRLNKYSFLKQLYGDDDFRIYGF